MRDKSFGGMDLVLLCMSLTLAAATVPGKAQSAMSAAEAQAVQPAGPTQLSAANQVGVAVARVAGHSIKPADWGAMDVATIERRADEETAAESGREQNSASRACADCLTPNAVLGYIGLNEWSYSQSGDCGTEGKWYAAFNGNAGRIYHFDLCPNEPGTSGTANFDADIKICNSNCAILAGVDGACPGGPSSYLPNDFQWTCTADGTYYVVIAPYSSYAQHNCTGTAASTFTLSYYAAVDPCSGNYPPNDTCEQLPDYYGGFIPTLAAGVPFTFYGDNTCAQLDCADSPTVWEAFTLVGSAMGWDVTLDYCGTASVWGKVYLNLMTGCPCTSLTSAASPSWGCPDGNVTMTWKGLTDGTYYYPVLYDAAYGSVGAYVVNVVANIHMPTYCDASGGCYEYIARVQVGTIDNASACTGYGDYTVLATDMTIGTGYPITVTIGDPWASDKGALWIDWNQDLDFEDAGEAIITTWSGYGPYATTITPPVGALLGNTRMRVRLSYSTVPPICGTTIVGECEDYTVHVLPAAAQGACCHANGTCAVTTEANCTGVWHSEWADCTVAQCPQPSGACCYPDGTCAVTMEADCTGDWHAEWQDCSVAQCPRPTGACCMTDGQCSVLTEDECVSAAGTYYGDSVDCTSNLCITGCDWLPGEGVSGTNGRVWVTTTWDPDGAGPEPELLIASGDFTVAGDVYANHIAAWNGSTWQPLGSGLDYRARALTVYNGELIAGGDFTTAGGVWCNFIARWNGSVWQPLGMGTNLVVESLTVYNGELIAGGNFNAADGVPCNHIARWNGSLWQPLGSGVDGRVHALTVYNAELIAAGDLSVAGGITCNRIARWNGSAWQALASGTDDEVSTLSVYNSELIAGGVFTTAGDVSCLHLARWNGSTWQPLGAGLMGGAVLALSVYEGELIAGGGFTTAGALTCNYIARWDGVAWQPAGAGMSSHVNALTAYDGHLIAGGVFPNAGNVGVSCIAAWNGNAWQALTAGISGRGYPSIRAWTVYDGELIAAGELTTAGDVSCSYVARWNGSGWQPLGSGLDSGACALAVYNGELIVGGSQTKAGGVTCSRIAGWSAEGGWQALGSGVNGTVYALTVYNGELIAGGLFTTAGGATSNNIARWNGSAWQTLAGGIGGYVFALTVYNGELIAGGYFESAGGVACKYIARWNGTYWQPLGSGMDLTVSSLSSYNGDLIAGGDFMTAGGVTCNYIARWDGGDWHPLGLGMSRGVSALTVYDDELIAGGSFARAGNIACSRIARWDGSAWAPLGTGISGGESGAYVSALTVYNGELHAGGDFTTAGEHLSCYWARWSCGSTLPGDLDCSGAVGFGDINPFVLYLSNFPAWQTAYPDCPAANGDIDGDGAYPAFTDINPFVALLTGR